MLLNTLLIDFITVPQINVLTEITKGGYYFWDLLNFWFYHFFFFYVLMYLIFFFFTLNKFVLSDFLIFMKFCLFFFFYLYLNYLFVHTLCFTSDAGYR